jgi:hypothetical protein
MQHLTGSELYFHELASTLAEEHDVVVCTHSASDWHRNKAKANNYQILPAKVITFVISLI